MRHAFEKPDVEFLGFITEQAHIDLHACRTQTSNALACDLWVRVLNSNHHACQASMHKCIAARASPALVAARLKRDVGRGTLDIVVLSHRITQGHHLGMCFSSTLCVTAAQHYPVSAHNDAADAGVG